jgi:large repetitive protein
MGKFIVLLSAPRRAAAVPAATATALIATATVLLGLLAMESPASAAAPPTVAAVSPMSGPTAGSTAVSITGTGFTGATAVHFGTTASNLFMVNSDSSITAYSPAEWGSTVDVTVTTAGGTSATSTADRYTYVPSPILLQLPQGTAFTYIGRSCGGIQEQSITDGFDPTSGFPVGLVYVSTRCGGSGRGGGGGSTLYSAWTSAEWDLTGTLITSSRTTAPASTDPTFSALDSQKNEVYNTVSTSNPSTCTTFMTSCNFKAYLLLASGFTPQPRLLGISVDLGPSSGGTTVSISGTGLTAPISVDFGSTAAESVVVNSDDSITAVSPPEAAGTVDLTVTTAGGTNLTSAADQFTFVAPPVVTGVSPDSGPVGGGYDVTVSGQNFTHTTGVSVGDQVASFVIVNDSELSVLVPGTDSGPDGASVIITTIGGTTSAPFTYTAPTGVAPTITSVDLATFAQGTAGTFQVTATGTPAPTFAESGTLPSGITMSSAGVLSGTATQSGDFPITIDATNGVAPDATQSFTLTVNAAGFQILTSSLPNATRGVAYGPVQLQAIGTGPGATLKWKKSGILPTGLKLTSLGLLSGTPNLRLVSGTDLAVPVKVTETVITVTGGRKVKTRNTVSKSLSVHVN